MSAEPLREPAFERLLQLLGPDRERSAEAYEGLRRRLLRFFAWRECASPEECVDLTFDRVGRRLDEGQALWAQDPLSYVFGVARNVAREARAGRHPAGRGEPLPAQLAPPAPADAEAALERERQLGALDQCLEQLGPESRELALAYYADPGGPGGKIAARQALAARLGLSLTALRLRMHRLRRQLEQCLRARLGPAK